MVLASVIGTCVLIGLLLVSLRFTRALFTGWLIFFVSIFPTMGVVSFTYVIAADKFAYLPSVGLLMILAWALTRLCATDKPKVKPVTIAIIILFLAFGESVGTRRYLRFWRSSESLYKHILLLTPNSVVAHNNLGNVLLGQGEFDEAIEHFRKALKVAPQDTKAWYNLGNAFKLQSEFDEAARCYNMALQLKSDYAEAHNNLGIVLKSQGKFGEAISHFHQAIDAEPVFAEAYNNLGITFQAQGNFNDAIKSYRNALELKTDYFKAHYNLANVLQVQGKLDEAILQFEKMVQLAPDSAPAHYILARAQIRIGKTQEAIVQFREAVRLEPEWVEAINALAWYLAVYEQSKIGDHKEAVRLAERACELTEYKHANLIDTLAVAYAALGRFGEAIEMSEKAIEVAESAGKKKLVEEIQDRLELYKSRRPYQQELPTKNEITP